ncbi:RNA polymerase sigma factor (sigma-70 family) [Arthrobacter sp. 1088]|uniref:RNA polymerase sigma factor n=1 Tax=Arthrobacter sp. 1088 TaxID=2817768 RepID=UPI002856D95F|nr:sigma-70 family RNA polymerase sigma factor [Arthrobacter sp. 1088]MDR6688318.1 RNA polymerase sigma factor (sigma-70 family) [Arthrobacter sp. 1088]
MGTLEYVSTGDGSQHITTGQKPLVGGLDAEETSAAVGHPTWALGAESELIEGVRSGDPEAMAALYGRHRDRALAFAGSLMTGAHEAEDVLHEAFVKTVSAIRNGRGPSDVFGPYLSTAIRSAANNRWVARGRELPTGDENLDPYPVDDPRLETVLSVVEHERIAEAMRSLPERWRTVLWHAEVMGHMPKEIAPVLGIAPNAVSALLKRARAGLRAAYGEQAAAGPKERVTRGGPK